MDAETAVPPGPQGKVCTTCGRSIPSDSLFCPFCGAKLVQGTPTQQPQAQYPYGQYYGYQYPYGYAQQPSGTSMLRRIGMGLGSMVTFLLLLLVSFNLMVLVWGISQVYPNVSGHGTYLFVITPWIIDVAKVTNVGLTIYYLILVGVIITCFGWMLKQSLHKFAHELTFQQPEGGHSPLYMISTLFFAVIAFNLVFYLMLSILGVSTNVPSESSDLWEVLFSLAQASVWEEIVTRVLLLGVPLFLVALAMGKVKDPKHYFLGGGFQFGKAETFFLVFSAAMFGIAHSFNWDWYKVLPAFVAGLAMGYLFLKFGLYASIMFHFFTDYLSISLSVWPNSKGLETLLGFIIVIFVIVGAVYFIRYLFKGYELFTGNKISFGTPAPVYGYPQQYYQQQYYQQYNGQYYYPYNQYYQGYQYQYQYNPQGQQYQQPPAQPDSPPQQAPGPRQGFGYVCPGCGNTEARYADGHFECLRCGRKS